MLFVRTIKLAFKNIRSSKLRSALTMLGLIIGISSVIVLVGIGTGSTQNVTSQVSSLVQMSLLSELIPGINLNMTGLEILISSPVLKA